MNNFFFGELMGQEDVTRFLETQFYKDSEKDFTKKEIENAVGKKIQDRSLITPVNYGEISRKLEIIKTKKGLCRRYRYKYVPNSPFIIADLRKGN